jgi:hypothetical protein
MFSPFTFLEAEANLLNKERRSENHNESQVKDNDVFINKRTITLMVFVHQV